MERKCRNHQCCTYNLTVTTAITKCIGCGCDPNSAHPFADLADLGSVFGSFFGGKS